MSANYFLRMWLPVFCDPRLRSPHYLDGGHIADVSENGIRRPLRDRNGILDDILQLILVIDGWGITWEVAFGWMPLDLIGARRKSCRQQALTWASVDPVLYRHMALLGYNELIVTTWKHFTHHGPFCAENQPGNRINSAFWWFLCCNPL